MDWFHQFLEDDLEFPELNEIFMAIKRLRREAITSVKEFKDKIKREDNLLKKLNSNLKEQQETELFF